MKRKVVLALLLQVAVAVAMLIPEDTEILNGFQSDSLAQLSPEDEYFEARSLSSGPLRNSIRNKRAIKHIVEDSDDLISHFRPNTLNSFSKRNERSLRGFKRWLKKKFSDSEEEESRRRRRSVENDKKIKVELTNENNKINQRSESWLNTMTSKNPVDDLAISANHDNPTAAALVGKFARSPFEYSKIQHEEDSMAMDTTSLNMNEGTKSRTPRVNFVTQQKKSLDHDDTKSSATKSDYYNKTPPLLHDSKEAVASSSERYPDRASTTRPSTYPDYKDRDINSNRYDDRYIEDMYPPPPEMYDPIDYNRRYMYRQPYGYSSRYDIPDYRDYPQMYGNEIDNPYYMRSDMMLPSIPSSLPRKRTIYYAYLPEVVRSPPTVDLRYRSYDRSYDRPYDRSYDPYYPDFYNQYEANMLSSAYRRPQLDRPMISEKAPLRYDHRSPRPMKTYNTDGTRNSSSIKEKRFDQEKTFYDGKMSANAYSHRRPSEFDQFYY